MYIHGFPLGDQISVINLETSYLKDNLSVVCVTLTDTETH